MRRALAILLASTAACGLSARGSGRPDGGEAPATTPSASPTRPATATSSPSPSATPIDPRACENDLDCANCFDGQGLACCGGAMNRAHLDRCPRGATCDAPCPPPPARCEGGSCVTPQRPACDCASDADCPADDVCDPELCACVPAGPPGACAEFPDAYTITLGPLESIVGTRLRFSLVNGFSEPAYLDGCNWFVHERILDDGSWMRAPAEAACDEARPVQVIVACGRIEGETRARDEGTWRLAIPIGRRCDATRPFGADTCDSLREYHSPEFHTFWGP